ncbi:T9SS type A sorting domain-containing protein [Flavobacterium faecale]|nr:T9SS type A sorting domain-containing protein [Flavobacterium faecale]
MKLKKLQKISLGLLTVFFTVSTIVAQPAAPSGKKWVKATYLSDDFNGSFDTSKWEQSIWNYAGTPTLMNNNNSGVSGGNLWIKATDNGQSNSGAWFQSSRVQSKAKVGFPMYTECRIKAANISAYSTYWLNNGDANNRDEIDICENNPKPSITSQTYRPYTMYSQYFIVKNGVTERNAGNFDNRNLPAGNPAKGVKWNTYQVLGCYWKDSKHVQFYINGAPAGSLTTTGVFTLAQNIIWDLWTGPFDYLGGLAVRSDLANEAQSTMYVDWINTYTLANITGKEVESKLKSETYNYKTSVSPNPVSNLLQVTLKSENDYNSYSIIDPLGRSVAQGKIAVGSAEYNVNVSSLKSGIYFLILNGEDDSEKIKIMKN